MDEAILLGGVIMIVKLSFEFVVENLKIKDLERLGITEFGKLQETPKITWLCDSEPVEINNVYDEDGKIKKIEIDYSLLNNNSLDYLRKLKHFYKDYFKSDNYKIRFPIECFIQEEDFIFEAFDSGAEVLVFQLSLSDLCKIVYDYVYSCLEAEIEIYRDLLKTSKEALISLLDEDFSITRLRDCGFKVKDLFNRLKDREKKFDALSDKYNAYDLFDKTSDFFD